MKPRLRVLVVGPLPPPVGGVETMTRAVLASESFRDFEVVHCDLTKGRGKQTQGKFDLGNLWWALIHFGRMLRTVAASKPRVVYMPLTGTWSGFWRDCVLAFIARVAGARIVAHVHGGGFARILHGPPLAQRAVRSMLKLFDVLLMLGSSWKDLVLDYGVRGQVTIVPPTMERELLESALACERRYEEQERIGLFVGHVGVRKGVLDLLESVALLRRRGIRVRIVLVGPEQRAGDYETIYRRHRELELEDLVEFTGPLVGDRLYRWFQDAAFLILPSYIEGLPIVFMEAGAFGLPVIGTPVGAVPDMLAHERNALLVQPGDVPGLADAIARLATSPAERRRLGMQLRRDVGRYHPEVVCQEIARVIREVDAGGAESPSRA